MAVKRTRRASKAKKMMKRYSKKAISALTRLKTGVVNVMGRLRNTLMKRKATKATKGKRAAQKRTKKQTAHRRK